MRKIYLLSISFLLAFSAYSQQETVNFPISYEKGYVYLKNGSVLKGRYFYTHDLSKLRVISGKNSWVFDAKEVDRVSGHKPEPIFTGESFGKEALPVSKFFNLTELGVLAGNNDNSQSAPMVVGSILNYSFYKNFSAGVGLGAEFLKETYMPLTANLIYKFRNTRFTPYAMFQTGYQVPIEDSRTLYYRVVPDYVSSSIIWPGPWPNSQSEMKAKGGFLVNPSLGFFQQSRSGFGMSMSLGYRFHRLKYKGDNDYRLDIDYNRLSVKLGIIIN